MNQPLPAHPNIWETTGLMGVPTKDINLHWPSVENALALAIARDPDYSEGDILERLLDGRWHLWVSYHSVAVCSPEAYPMGPVYNVRYGAGELGDMQDCMRCLKLWAEAEGYRALQVAGREGWGRALGDLGFREVSRVHRVEID